MLLPIAVLALLLFKDVWWVMVLGYFTHLLFDVPTHEGDFAQKPLYPLSDWTLHGKKLLSNIKLVGFYWAELLIVVVLLQRI